MNVTDKYVFEMLLKHRFKKYIRLGYIYKKNHEYFLDITKLIELLGDTKVQTEEKVVDIDKVIPGWAQKIAVLFFETKQEQYPKSKPLTKTQQYECMLEIKKLMGIDGYSKDDIRETIKWFLKQPESYFWVKQLRSPRTLRKMCKDERTKFEHIYADYLKQSEDKRNITIEYDEGSLQYKYLKKMQDIYTKHTHTKSDLHNIMEELDNHFTKLNKKHLAINRGEFFTGFCKLFGEQAFRMMNVGFVSSLVNRYVSPIYESGKVK